MRTLTTTPTRELVHIGRAENIRRSRTCVDFLFDERSAGATHRASPHPGARKPIALGSDAHDYRHHPAVPRFVLRTWRTSRREDDIAKRAGPEPVSHIPRARRRSATTPPPRGRGSLSWRVERRRALSLGSALFGPCRCPIAGQAVEDYASAGAAAFYMPPSLVARAPAILPNTYRRGARPAQDRAITFHEANTWPDHIPARHRD